MKEKKLTNQPSIFSSFERLKTPLAKEKELKKRPGEEFTFQRPAKSERSSSELDKLNPFKSKKSNKMRDELEEFLSNEKKAALTDRGEVPLVNPF